MAPPALDLTVHRQPVRALPGPQPLAGRGMEVPPNGLKLLLRDLAHETEFRRAGVGFIGRDDPPSWSELPANSPAHRGPFEPLHGKRRTRSAAAGF
jgi:hypothetical protein